MLIEKIAGAMALTYFSDGVQFSVYENVCQNFKLLGLEEKDIEDFDADLGIIYMLDGAEYEI